MSKRVSDDGARETPMVPRAEFRSYYGRPVLKPPAWHDDIGYYFFLGGLSAGSSLLAAGADLTGRPRLRRGAWIGAFASIGLGSYYLVHDLGRPERFLNMLRVAKPTSPMSMGTWIIAAYAPGVGVAALSELLPRRLRGTLPGRVIDRLARPAGLATAAIAPAVASYTAALLSQTAVPAWHESHPELPFIFTGSAAAAAGGLGMLVAPASEAAPARRLAAYGAVVEVAATRVQERRPGIVGEAFTTGQAHRDLQRASRLTIAGAAGAALFGGRSRLAAAAAGAALLVGSYYERMGLLRAGFASAKDPRYTVLPQRSRVDAKWQATH
jgi:formate-dependent nitrite reductase membrane component NrfD